MKKLLIVLAFAIGIGSISATAQVDKTKSKKSGKNYKTKVKPTSTVGEKVHNVFSKNNKYSGVKVKGKNKKTDAKTKVEVRTKKADN